MYLNHEIVLSIQFILLHCVQIYFFFDLYISGYVSIGNLYLSMNDFVRVNFDFTYLLRVFIFLSAPSKF